MSENKHSITPKQMMAFIISAQIGFGVLFLPSSLAEAAGHDGWISTMLSGFASILAAIVIIALLKRYKTRDISQINLLLYGKFLGIILNVVFFTYLLLITSMNARLFTEIIKITVLNLTPPMVIAITVSAPTIYMSWLGLKVICRFSSSLLLTFFSTLLCFFLAYKKVRLTFVMPVGEAGIGSILNGMLKVSYIFLGIELIPIIYPYITDKKAITKYAAGAISFSVIFNSIVIFFITALTGEEKLKMLRFPLFNLSKSFHVPIIERLDLLFIILWFPVMGSSLRTYYFSAYHMIDKVLNIKNKKLPIIIFAFIVFLIGKLPGDLNSLFKYLNSINIGGLAVICFLLLSYFFSLLKEVPD